MKYKYIIEYINDPRQGWENYALYDDEFQAKESFKTLCRDHPKISYRLLECQCVIKLWNYININE